RINLGARINVGDFTLNIRENIYGPQYTLSSASSYPQSVRDELDLVTLGTGLYYKNQINELYMTNVELTYTPTDALRLSVGMDNIFNEYPDKTPSSIWNYNEERYANTSRAYLTGSPVGFFGSRWFAKLGYDF